MSENMEGQCGNVAAVIDELFFKDEYLEYLCHVGLTKTLTRTADGGNDAIRVKELADMVKHLRKAVQAYQKKLRQLQATEWPPAPDQNTADAAQLHILCAETQTSPRTNDPGAALCS